MFKVVASIALLATLVNAETLQLNNKLSNDIVASITNNGEVNIPAGSSVEVDVGENWVGEVHARTADCTDAVCSEIITLVELATTNNYNVYDISLVKGFNLPVQVTPLPEGSCKSISCPVQQLINECPEENQVTVNGNIVACRLSPDLFNNYCSSAFVDPITDRTVVCPVGTNYRIDFEWA